MSFHIDVSRPKTRRTPLLVALVLVVVILGAGIVYALLQLQVPSTPGVSAPSGAAKITSACGGSLVTVGSPPFPSSGTFRYTCDSTHGAFTVAIVGTDMAIFNLPGNYTSLGIVTKASASCGSPTPLSSGHVFNFTISTDYDLCAPYVSTTGGTMPGFGVQWST